jgi:hypothetical protein
MLCSASCWAFTSDRDVLPQFGSHHPRPDHRHTDLLPGDLLAQGLGERAQHFEAL